MKTPFAPKKRIYELAMFFWFHIGWLGCIFSEKWNWGHAAWIIPIISLTLLFKIERFSLKYALGLVAAFTAGLSFDLLSSAQGWIYFSPTIAKGAVPLWLIALWAHFVTILPITLNLFKNKIWLSAPLAAVFGPLSYMSGAPFEVLYFSTQQATFVYAIFWAIYYPISLFGLKKLTSQNQVVTP